MSALASTSTATTTSTTSTTTSASGVDAIEHIVGAMWRAKGDETLTSIVTEGKKALAAIIGKDTELKTIAVNAGAEDGWLPADGA